MTYTKNGKEWTEFDINKRCAELMEIDAHVVEWAFGWAILHSRKASWVHYDPCTNPSDTWPIIEKCWERLHSTLRFHPLTDWEFYASEHESKLVAACICFIEDNESMKELTDLEICKRIAEIEGKSYWINGTGEGVCINYIEGKRASKVLHYNPLTDDALCFKLMVKYRIAVEFTRYYEKFKSITIKAFYDDVSYGSYIRDTSPNRAICLAIIESKEGV